MLEFQRLCYSEQPRKKNGPGFGSCPFFASLDAHLCLGVMTVMEKGCCEPSLGGRVECWHRAAGSTGIIINSD